MSNPPLKAAIIPVTPLQQNCTLLWCTETMLGAFVDPGGDLDRLKAAAAQTGVTIEKILLTHGHIDHCGSAGILAAELGVPIEGPQEEDRFWIARLEDDGMRYGVPGKPFEPDRWLEDGDTVTVGKLTFNVRHCPGHTPGPHRLPPSRIEAGAGRRRAVPGIDRPHRFPPRQSLSNCSIRSPSGCGRWAATPASSPATARCRPSAMNGRPIRSSPTRCLQQGLKRLRPPVISL